jgi:tRNA pseudouridine55 synthase
MAALVRSKQGEFTNIDPAPEGYVPALTYEDLEFGEDVWGPKITKVLEEWVEKHPPVSTDNRIDDRDRPGKDYRYKRSNYGGGWRGSGQKRSWNDRKEWKGSRQTDRRNSSSPES